MPLKATDYGGQHSVDKNPTPVFWARFCCCRNWIMIKCTGCMGRHKMRHNGLPASQQLGRSGRMMHWRDGEGGQGGHRRYVERIVTMKCNFVLLLYKLHWVKYLDVSCPYNDAPKLSIMAVVAYGLTQQCFSYSVWLRETADSSHRVSLRSQLQNASGLRMIINILCSSLMRPAHWAVLNTLLGTCVSLCNLFT